MSTNKFENHCIEELIRLAGSGDEAAFEKLSAIVKPIILNAARMYRGRIPGYEIGDLIQEGYVLLWQLVRKEGIGDKAGNFRAYFKVAVQHRFIRIFQHYYSFNPVILSEKACCEYNIVYTAESEYIKKYRAKQREYYHRKKTERQGTNCLPVKKQHFRKFPA